MHQAWTTGRGDARRRVLPGRRRDRAAAAAAARRHPDLDRRRRREGDAEDRGEVRRSTRTSRGTPEEFAHKSEVLRGHCEALGTDFDAITRSSNFNTVIGTDAADVAPRLDAHRGARRARTSAPRRPRATSRTSTAPNAARRARPPQIVGEARRAARARPRLRRSSTSPRRRTTGRGSSCSRPRSCPRCGSGARRRRLRRRLSPCYAARPRRASPESSASVGSVKWVPSGKTTTGIWVRPLIAFARSAPSNYDLEVDVVVVDAARGRAAPSSGGSRRTTRRRTW